MCVLVTQWCLTAMPCPNCSLPGSSVCGILQGRLLEWVAIPAIPFSRDLSNPGSESPTLQADSLLSEIPGKPRDNHCNRLYVKRSVLKAEENTDIVKTYWIPSSRRT